MSFGCYQPNVNTSMGCRSTTANMSLGDQRRMSERFTRESRNPITGEVISYSQQKSSLYDKQKGFAASSSAVVDAKPQRKMMPEQKNVSHLQRNLTVTAEPRAQEMSRMGESNLGADMLPAPGAFRRDYDDAASVVSGSRVSNAGGECGFYLKPKDQLGPGMLPTRASGTQVQPPRLQGRLNVKATEFGYMGAAPMGRQANADKIAEEILQRNPAARYYNIDLQ